MTELSQENPDQHQISELENSSAEILKILEEFVISGKYQLKTNKKKDGNIQKNSNIILLNISLNKLSLYFFIVGILSLISILIMDRININEIFIIGFLKLATFVLLCLLGLICWRFYREFKKTIKDTTKKAISRAANYKIYRYYEVINILGNQFSQESLSKEEIRFKVIINQRKNGKSLLNKLIPAVAILIVIWGIYIFGMPNYNRATNQLLGAFLSVSGIITMDLSLQKM